ncbi:hypothetical protein M514_01684 [Trichuris suis]|uniref:Major facilitator superfamily (MFS) profile domain-containing protein n=1 Tax=Trichuris suis TaxID=68888 RepID=A0A085N5X3_9BILA|nr:hypothetical protein M514_01684 [Trichuris suis]
MSSMKTAEAIQLTSSNADGEPKHVDTKKLERVNTVDPLRMVKVFASEHPSVLRSFWTLANFLTNCRRSAFMKDSSTTELIVCHFDGYRKGRLTGPLIFAICASALGSSFIFGYSIGVMNAPEKVIKAWINSTSSADKPYQKEDLDNIWASIVGFMSFGGLIGGMLSGYVADRFGRRNGMLLNNVIAFLGAGLMAGSKSGGSFVYLLIGRIVIGICCGINSAICPMYLTEISPINLRGMLGSVNQLVVTISILVSQVLGLSSLLGTETLWPIVLLLTIVPAIFQLATLPFCPESPKYLLIHQQKLEAAKVALQKLRQSNDVEAELQIMTDESKKMLETPKVKFTDMFKDKVLRWALFICVMMMLSQQLSGINAVMFYSTRIFDEGAGLGPEKAQYATMGVGATNVIMTIVSTAIIDRAGRRTLHLIGLGGMWVTSIGLTISMALLKQGMNTAVLCIIFVILFVVAFATGPGAIPWFFVSELFMQNARGHATSVAVPVNWGAAFIVGWAFPPMQNAIGEYSFLVFAGFLTFFWLFTYKFVPETKNRSVEDVVEGLKRSVGQK